MQSTYPNYQLSNFASRFVSVLFETLLASPPATAAPTYQELPGMAGAQSRQLDEASGIVSLQSKEYLVYTAKRLPDEASVPVNGCLR